MNRTDLTKLAAKRAGMSQRQTKRAVDAFLDVVSMALTAGEEVNIRSFGNLMTKEEFPVQRGFYRPGEDSPYYRVGFKPSKTLKRRVNRRRQHG